MGTTAYDEGFSAGYEKAQDELAYTKAKFESIRLGMMQFLQTLDAPDVQWVKLHVGPAPIVMSPTAREKALREALEVFFKHLDTYGVVSGGHEREMASQEACFDAYRAIKDRL